ncbi:hypothetical protein ACX3PU_08255 [Chryseobacterium sp. A301]
MANINIAKAPKNVAIAPFYISGALCFLTLCVMMLFSSSAFLGHYFSAYILAIVHMAALGWGTMIIFGASYQLLPVICERSLFSEKLALSSWALLLMGLLILVCSFWHMYTGWLMVSGGTLVVVAAVLYLINVLKTASLCKTYSIQRLFMASSAFWLVFTTSVGVLLAYNLAFPYISSNHLDFLKLHAHAGLGGWFLQLITGVSTKLVPMFLLGKSQKERFLVGSFVLQNLALVLFLVDGFFFGITLRVVLYAALTLSGVILWMLYLYDAFKNRLRKKIELLMKHTFVSMMVLLLSLLLIPVIYLTSSTSVTVLYGTLLFMGWITGIILGKTFKTLPFIVWNSKYKHLSGKKNIPLPKTLYSEKLVKFQFILYLAALTVLSLGILFQTHWVIQLGLILWVSVAGIYLVNVSKLFNHLIKTTHS